MGYNDVSCTKGKETPTHYNKKYNFLLNVGRGSIKDLYFVVSYRKVILD